MAYISDRQRVELMLLPMLAHGIVVAGANDPDGPEATEAKGHFQAAVLQAIEGLDLKKQGQLTRRTLKLSEDLTAEYRKVDARVDKVGLILFYILRWATESDYLVLHPGTPMSDGLDLLLPGLEHAANITKLDDSARKAAVKMLKRLHDESYFRGVTVTEEGTDGHSPHQDQ